MDMLVGREAELRALCDALDEVRVAKAPHATRLVGLWGEHGSGKSMLAGTFVNAAATSCRFTALFCTAVTQHSPYSLCSDLLFASLGSDVVSATTRFRRAVALLRDASGSNQVSDEHLSLLAEVGLEPGGDDADPASADARGTVDGSSRPSTPARGAGATTPSPAPRSASGLSRSAALQDLLCILFTALTPPTAPLLLVIEDAHWMDVESAAVLNRLVSEGRAASLILAVGRRDAEPHLEATLFRSPAAPPIVLGPLADGHMRCVINRCASLALGTTAVAPKLEQQLVDASQGLPGYAIEMVSHLCATEAIRVDGRGGVAVLAEPDSLAGAPPSFERITLARLDALSERALLVVKTLAVVGAPVDVERTLLPLYQLQGDSVTVASLLALVDQELGYFVAVDSSSDGESAGDGVWVRMVDESVRQIVYRSLPRSFRQPLHRAVAAQWTDVTVPSSVSARPTPSNLTLSLSSSASVHTSSVGPEVVGQHLVAAGLAHAARPFFAAAAARCARNGAKVEAGRWTDAFFAAEAESSTPSEREVLVPLLLLRGKVRRARGEAEGAAADFGAALRHCLPTGHDASAFLRHADRLLEAARIDSPLVEVTGGVSSARRVSKRLSVDRLLLFASGSSVSSPTPSSSSLPSSIASSLSSSSSSSSATSSSSTSASSSSSSSSSTISSPVVTSSAVTRVWLADSPTHDLAMVGTTATTFLASVMCLSALKAARVSHDVPVATTQATRRVLADMLGCVGADAASDEQLLPFLLDVQLFFAWRSGDRALAAAALAASATAHPVVGSRRRATRQLGALCAHSTYLDGLFVQWPRLEVAWSAGYCDSGHDAAAAIVSAMVAGVDHGTAENFLFRQALAALDAANFSVALDALHRARLLARTREHAAHTEVAQRLLALTLLRSGEVAAAASADDAAVEEGALSGSVAARAHHRVRRLGAAWYSVSAGLVPGTPAAPAAIADVVAAAAALATLSMDLLAVPTLELLADVAIDLLLRRPGRAADARTLLAQVAAAISSIVARRQTQRLGVATLQPTLAYLAGWQEVASSVAGGLSGRRALTTGTTLWTSGLVAAGCRWPPPSPGAAVSADPVSLPFHLGRLRASLGHHPSLRSMGAFGWIPQQALADEYGVEWTVEEMKK